MAYIEIDFNTVELHIEDLAPSEDPISLLGLTFAEDLQDDILTALGDLVAARGFNCTVRVKRPPQPVVPLVAEMTTIPF